MKVIGVIPARYASTRFPGKPLVDICGKPMIWWVYKKLIDLQGIDKVVVATDSDIIVDVLKKYDIQYIYTKEHPDHIARVQEVSTKIKSDFYLCINGDEPLIEVEAIETVVKYAKVNKINTFCGAYRELVEPSETIDNGNIKLCLNEVNKLVYASRTPIPFPQKTVMFKYNKYVGIELFSKNALDFFVNKPMGKLENIEDIDHLRFVENNYDLYFCKVDSNSISVDTKKDLEKVIEIFKQRYKYE